MDYTNNEPKLSQREVARRYILMLDKLKAPVAPNRFNCYVCNSCQHITKTIDVDNGVIPMYFDCEVCGKLARSSFFKDLVPEKNPTIEWYRPTLDECIKMRRKQSLLEYILMGGLSPRKVMYDVSLDGLESKKVIKNIE